MAATRRGRVGSVLFPLLAVLFHLSVSAQTPEKLELRLRLKKGDVYKLKLTIDQKITHTPPAPTSGGDGAPARPEARPAKAGTPQSTEQLMAVGFTMTVKEVDGDGAMTIATKYESVLFRQKGPAGVVEFDSTNPPKQPPALARAFAILPGLGFTMTLTPAGDVKSLEGTSEMLAEMVRRLDLPEGPARANAQKVLAEHFGEAAMRQNMQDLFALYPPGPVAAGESWERKVVVNKGFPVVMHNTYTLKARAAGVAEIAVKSRLSPNAEAGPVELGTGKTTYDLSGEQRGAAKVVEATGWTESLVTEQDIAGTIVFRTGDSSNSETTVPITVKSKVVLEPVK